MCHWQNTLWPLGRILFETFYCLPLSSSYKTAHGHWPHVNVCRVSCGGVVNMMLVFWITSFFITKNGFVCVQLAHFSMGDCKDVHLMLLSSSNRKYPPFPLLSNFSVAVCLRCLSHHILLHIAYTFRENREFVFTIIVQFMMSANNRIHFVLKIVFVFFVHNTISLSSLWKLIWRHWTYKMPVRYILSSVWVR